MHFGSSPRLTFSISSEIHLAQFDDAVIEPAVIKFSILHFQFLIIP